MAHIPVLQKEIIEYLNPQTNENFIDATFGEGGHSTSILHKNGPIGKVLGIEVDSALFQLAKKRMDEFSIFNSQFSNRLILVNDSYANLKDIIKSHGFQPVNGILADLGLSMWHFKESGRGFSFQKNEELDMRFSLRTDITAKEIINKWPRQEIEKILKEYGEERFYKRIAENVLEQRKKQAIATTFQLAEIIKRAVPFRKQRTHPATKTFQALRIAVNDELNNLRKILPLAIEALDKKGRLAIISFHSLEDRIVKNFFREKAKEGTIKIITKKPINPSFEEINKNPSSRSAKLRVCLKI